MNTPNRLFKYVGFNSRVLQQLCDGEVHFADPSTFNDPLDCRPTIKTDLPIPDLKDVLAQLMVRRVSQEVAEAMKRMRFKAESIQARQELLPRKDFETLIQNIQYEATNPDVADAEEHIRFALGNAIEFELRKAYDLGVLCLSSKYDSPLMWSHYADQHRGICIEFDVSKLPPDSVRKVLYGNSRELNASTVQQWLLNNSPAARQEIERACLLTKSTEWGYESEYRLLGRIGAQTSVATFKSITFGLKCENTLQYAVIASLGGNDAPIDFFQINQPGARFELTRSPVNIDETLVGMPRINILDEFEVLPPIQEAPHH